MRLRARLAAAAAVAAAALGVAAPESSAAAVCPLAGNWAQTTQGVGSSTWTITADGHARETGLGNATGTATLGGGVLTITWATTNGYAGVYRWTLDAQCGGRGMLTLTKQPAGDTRGATFASTVDGPPPASAGDPAIRLLQRDLKRLGLYSGPLDGTDSARLNNAVRSFQRRVGLAGDGTCSRRCVSALHKALGLDDPKRGPGAAPRTHRTVKVLQRDLKRLGFYSGPLDGRYRARTKAAVKRFQRRHGLRADGRCGARCQFAIVKALIR